MKLPKRLRHGLETAVRWIATALILWRVYLETGPWTVAALFMVTVAIEVFAWRLGQHSKVLVLLHRRAGIFGDEVGWTLAVVEARIKEGRP